ncbi:carbohydrate sulfotransferase 11 [Anthonomus grandis grandis]|uniref:carbohydrate sulfotransferase 11 n=1 Tax=Anthonomus grandis grandis TaxID=2921223 RepID=UPI002166B4D0|nr:carbohydrate sulfotransferase 11 [Anthonomus grandis grandis]
MWGPGFEKSQWFLVAVLVNVSLPFCALSDTESYPWLEQITRQEDLTLGCDNLGLTRLKPDISQLHHILVDHTHKLLYCYVPKVACTNWKRVMMVLTGQSNATNLVNIPADLAHANSSTVRLSEMTKAEANRVLGEYTMFLIARHPFERLLSAYRNKFVDSLPSSKYFQSRYGKYILKKYRPSATPEELESGVNVTFTEFVSFLLNDGVDTNEHWTPIYDLCLPCSLNYSFIGHYETLSQDAKTILDMVDAPSLVFPVTRAGHTRDRLREYFQQLSIFSIEHLYKKYLADFKLFGYGLEDLIGYDLA